MLFIPYLFEHQFCMFIMLCFYHCVQYRISLKMQQNNSSVHITIYSIFSVCLCTQTVCPISIKSFKQYLYTGSIYLSMVCGVLLSPSVIQGFSPSMSILAPLLFYSSFLHCVSYSLEPCSSWSSSLSLLSRLEYNKYRARNQWWSIGLGP